MELPDFIQIGNKAPALRFRTIAGWAIAAHGCGVKPFRESGAFAQFTPEAGDGFDLMLVDDQTFEQMGAALEARIFGDVKARVPGLEHLFTLKRHALRQNLPHRTSKDADEERWQAESTDQFKL